MLKCVDCTLPIAAGVRCDDCAAEVAETPHWRAPEVRRPAVGKRAGRPAGPIRVCLVDGCDIRSRRLAGYCEKHNYRYQRYGDPLKLTRLPSEGRQPRPCLRCGVAFKPWSPEARFCSLACFGQSITVDRSSCRSEGCENAGRERSPWCRECEAAKWPRDIERARASWRRHTHLRKARTRRYDISLATEREMRAKAKRCPLCKVRLIDEPYQPASKELDHMVPLNVGGTHTLGNVRIICRSCNVRRPKDGSDYTGPVTLWAIA